MRTECANLKELFGDRFKIDVDESYYAERPEFRREEEPWPLHIACQNGHICPWGGTTLAACTNTAGAVASRLKVLPFTKPHQDGADGANILFDLEHFEEVAAIMKPRKRRRLSEEHKTKLMEAGAKFRFSAGSHGPEIAPERDGRGKAA